MKSRLNREGARGVLMSGSGSSVFAIVDDIASAEQIATNLTRDNIHAHACKIVHAIR